jgi:hypothetical protein
MKEQAVTHLISNLYVLRGYIRDLHIKFTALEETLKEAEPLRYAQYRQVLRQLESESKPETTFPLENVEELRKALLQD